MNIPIQGGSLDFAPGSLFTINAKESLSLSVPRFQVDGKSRNDFRFVSAGNATPIKQGVDEYRITYETETSPQLTLKLVLRVSQATPVIRFRYELHAAEAVCLTNVDNRNAVEYFAVTAPGSEAEVSEIQFSNFDPGVHSFVPHKQTYPDYQLRAGLRFAGPIALIGRKPGSLLAAFEHGSEHPETFLGFGCELEDNALTLTVSAVKGNYYHGQEVSMDKPFTSVWFELCTAGTSVEDLLKEYRRFVLDYMAESEESRLPYVYYNSWNYQERQKYFENKPYLSEMNTERMCQEIDVAHQIGVDVFVIDTGWYTKTGDWWVNQERFPENMQAVRERLQQYGMKLGLWFNPIVAAKSSEIVKAHPEYIMEQSGKQRYHDQIWETEGSYGMCLASNYADWFIEKLCKLHEELGVSYFKWDGIGQYGCDSADHNHGTEDNSPEERAQCYAYEMGRQMIRIASEVSRRCPGVIVDFDITEGGRFVGLGFLAAGKYFLINNGPYFHNFDIPDWVNITPDTINVFFYPGAARPRVCRQGILFDSFVPSILFLTHFLPDKPRLSQENSTATMLLGGNGIWGDLVTMDKEDVQFFQEQITRYKSVAKAVVRSYPITNGFIGSSPEIYEKLDPETGKGLMAMFAVKKSSITYLTQPLNIDSATVVYGADAWERKGKQLQISVELGADEARVVYVDRQAE